MVFQQHAKNKSIGLNKRNKQTAADKRPHIIYRETRGMTLPAKVSFIYTHAFFSDMPMRQ